MGLFFLTPALTPSSILLLDSYIGRMEAQSNVKFSQAQIALSRIWMGDSAPPTPSKAELEKRKEKRKWGRILSRDRLSKEFELMPRSVDHAKEIVYSFQQAMECVREYEHVADSVAHHAMRTSTSLLDEKWYGRAHEERQAYVDSSIK